MLMDQIVIKEPYTGLSTTRTAVESALLQTASKIQGATKTEDWKEININEVMGMDDISLTTSSPTQDAKRDSYWKTDF